MKILNSIFYYLADSIDTWARARAAAELVRYGKYDAAKRIIIKD